MFKRLKEKIVEEVKQSPIRFPQFPGQVGPGECGSNSDASFSITEDDQQPNEEDAANSSTDLLPLYRPPENSPALVAPSDAESEPEELSLDLVSKEQLWAAFQTARARVRKYRNKYSEAVQAYRSLDTEKEKIRRILSESQDKALRRMGELREQAQLEQQAKAHLEENLRCQLEEKEHIIQTLETKVSLLKANNAIPGAPCESTGQEEELAHYREKVQRLETLMAKCKDTIQNSRERSTQLMQEREALARALDEKGRQLQQLQCRVLQENEAEAQAKWRLEQQELEQQARQLTEALTAATADKDRLQAQLSESQAQHQQQLAAVEKALEEERSRTKAADLRLLKQECDKKIEAAEHNWVQKLEASEKEYHRRISEKENELRRVAKKLSELKSITEESEEQEDAEDTAMSQGDGLLRDIESYQLVKNNLEQSVQLLKAELAAERERAAQVQLQLTEEADRLRAELQEHTNAFRDLQAQLDRALQEKMAFSEELKGIQDRRAEYERSHITILEESRQRESQLAQEVQLLKSQAEQDQNALQKRCEALEKDIEEIRRFAEEKEAEVIKLTSEAEDIRREHQLSLSQLEESGQRETELMQQLDLLKSQTEQELSVQLEKYIILEKNAAESRLLAEEKQAQVSRSSCEAEDLRKELQINKSYLEESRKRESQLEQDLTLLKLQTEQGQVQLLDKCRALESSLEEGKKSEQERQSVVAKLTSEAEDLRKELQVTSSQLEESRQNELQLTQEVQLLKSQIVDQSALLERCECLERSIEDQRVVVEGRQSEVLRLTSEVEDLREDLEANISQQRESKQRESHLMQEVECLKSQLEQEQSTHQQQCDHLEKSSEEMKMLAEEKLSEVARLASEAANLQKELQTNIAQLEESRQRESQLLQEVNLFKSQRVQDENELLQRCAVLENEADKAKQLAEERQSEVIRLASVVEHLQKEMETNLASLGESIQRESQLTEEMQLLKSQIAQDSSALLERCRALEEEVGEARRLAEERQLELAKVTSEAESLRKDLQVNAAQLEESRRRESQLAHEMQLSKSQTEQDQSTLLEQCRSLQKAANEASQLAAERQSEVAKLTGELGVLRKEVQTNLFQLEESRQTESQLMHEVNLLKSQREQDQTTLPERCKALERQVEEIGQLSEEKKSEVASLTCEVSGLRNQLESALSELRESKQRESELMEEMNSLKLQAEQVRSAHLEECKALKDNVEVLSVQKQSEVAELHSEVEILQTELQTNSTKIDESRQRESALMQEMECLKAQMEEDKNVLRDQCNAFEHDVEEAKLLSEQRHSEISRLNTEIGDLRSQLQDSSSQLEESRQRESQVMQKLNSLKLQKEQDQCTLLKMQENLEKEVKETRLLLEEKEAEITRVTSEAEKLHRKLQKSSSCIDESRKRETELTNEVQALKLHAQEELSALSQKCGVLQKNGEELRILAEERHSEIARLSTECKKLRSELQAVLLQLEESRQREFQLIQEIRGLKSEMEEEQSALLNCFRSLEEDTEEVGLLQEEEEPEVYMPDSGSKGEESGQNAEVSQPSDPAMDSLVSEASGLRNILKTVFSDLRKAKQRESQLVDKIRKGEERTKTALQRECENLREQVNMYMQSSGERQSEVCKLRLEAQVLEEELQAKFMKLQESRQKEFVLTQENQALKSEIQQERSALLDCFKGLENGTEEVRLLSEEDQSRVSTPGGNHEGFQKKAQLVCEERQMQERRQDDVEPEVTCTGQGLLQAETFHKTGNEERHTAVVAQLKAKLTALLHEKQLLSGAEQRQQGRIKKLEESLQQVESDLRKQLSEAEARAKHYEQQLQTLQEQLASSTKTEAAHPHNDRRQHQASDCETSGQADKSDEEAGPHAGAQNSGWDDAWPDEEEWGPRECPADERIEALQLTLGRYRDEINDLRSILRAQQNNNAANHTGKNPVQLPEPTEYEYLRNILFEYMMGKETVTLSKVIAAVLKFSDEQKNQILQREEARQPQVRS
ncbi:LOW QUALITY PROTEIN: uncharacterized protein LOC144126279 [Amblyomma americanum]